MSGCRTDAVGMCVPAKGVVEGIDTSLVAQQGLFELGEIELGDGPVVVEVIGDRYQRMVL